ncbi:MAG: hypothetical protein R3E70_04810 [Burkholderiaceae bacterium]
MTAQAPAATSRTAAPGAAEVDAFIDALWLEDGPNSWPLPPDPVSRLAAPAAADAEHT